MRQCGVLRAHSWKIFFDLTRALERFGPLSMKGNQVFLATFPGGEGVIVTDLLEQHGLRLAETSSATLDKLRAVFPPGTSQPTLGPRPHDTVSRSGEHLFDHPRRDGCRPQCRRVGHTDSPGVPHGPKEFMGVFLRATEARKPIVLWLAGMEPGRHENLMWLEDKGVPVFSSPEKAVSALAALHRLSRS